MRTACAVCLLFAAGGALADDAVYRRFADELVPLTPGKGDFPAAFRMGSDDGPAAGRPAREVKLVGPFAVARYEVTQELYQAIAGKNPSRWKGRRNSVEMVSWDEANAFCTKLTTELHRLKLLDAKDLVRLPSEAEWEYACRAGGTTRYSFGDKADALGDYAWFKGNAAGNDPPVGKKKPNAWGLYDVHGYVWEWCLDAWHADYKGAPADSRPRSADDATERVIRGGSWADDAESAGSAFRAKARADHRSEAIGFRCVRAPKD